MVYLICFFYKTLLSMAETIGRLFLFVNGYFTLKSKGWRCGWVMEDGAAAALLSK